MIVEMGNIKSTDSDVVLLRQIAGGDEAAFRELYFRYNVPIFNFVLRLIHEQKEAEDF